ncbi:hypothetical protein FCH33_07035 [Serratia fonticola]|uniref:hypothetical protein n=1 Tax=Serratia fonticola TaxID=47917 RepID=UPI001574F9EB|nr:hypothetical protein [Serratia fonticola]NTY86525.1 hypothetical protein [Serratia fonticola]NTZ12410.1 hypothetical protein [Serratia fonticola]
MFKRVMVTVVGMLLGAMAPLYAYEGDKKWGRATAYTVKGEGLSSFTLICTTNGTPYVIYVNEEGQRFTNHDFETQPVLLFISVDGGEAVLVNELTSSTGLRAFASAWEKLRQGKQLAVWSNDVFPSSFTLRRAADSLPPLASSGCVPEVVFTPLPAP